MAEKLSNNSRVLFDKDRGEFFLGNDITFDGEITLQQFVQTTPSDKWEIDLRVEGILMQAFIFQDNGDDTYSQITPESLQLVTTERLQICFAAPVAGVVNILLSSDAQELILVTPTPAVTGTPTPTPTQTINPTPTITPTSNVTPSPSPTPTVTASITPSVTVTPTITPTSGATATPTVTPTSTVTPSVTATVTVTPTITPSTTPPADADGLIAALNPVIDWRYEEAISPMLNSGSAGSAYDLPAAIGSPSYQETGADIAGNFAVGLDGNTSTEGFYVDPVTNFAAFTGMGPGGTVIAVVKFTGDRSAGSATFGQTVFFGQGTGSFYEFSMKIEEPSNGRLEYELSDNATQRQQIRSDLEISDGAYHLVVITQPHDGSGPSLYIDGKPDEFTNSVDVGFEDFWVEDVSPSWISFPTGYRAFTGADGTTGGVGGFTGNLDRITFTNTVMSPAQIEELFTTMFGDPDYLYVDGKSHLGGSTGVAYKVFADDDGFQSVPEFNPVDPVGNFWNDCAWDRTNTYFAVSRSSFGQLAYFFKWDETDRTIGHITDVPGNGQPAWSGNFKLGCAWSPTRDEFVLAGETNPRLELALRSGDTITVQSNPFSSLPVTNQYFARFHPSGDWLISIGNLSSGEAIHVYERNSVSDFQKVVTPVDTQPNGGNITQCPRHGLAWSPDGNQVAIFGFHSVNDVADISVYNFNSSTGALTTAATGFVTDISPSSGFSTFQSVAYTPNSRFLYWGGSYDSIGSVRGWDRNSGYSEITLGGWVDQPGERVSQLSTSPDGKYLAVIFDSTSKRTELYSINQSTGALTFVREFVANAPSTSTGAVSGAFMNPGGDFPVPTATPSPTPSPTDATNTPTPTPTVTPTVTPTISVTPTQTVTPTVTGTPGTTPTPTPSATPPAALSTGYTTGGKNPAINTIQSFPYAAPFTVGTDVGNLTASNLHGSGQSSDDDGYNSGGQPAFPLGAVNVMNQFPFSSPFVTATDIGDLSTSRAEASGQSSSTDGYASGGAPVPVGAIIDRFPFSTPFTTATNVGSLFDGRATAGGASSATDGYASGGWSPGSSNVIDRFPFSTPFTTATDIGDLTLGRYSNAGVSSTTDGFSVGGGSFFSSSDIERWPFSTPFTNATVVGNLLANGSYRTGVFSGTDGYSAGGQPDRTQVDSFPFSSPFTTATDVGDLFDSISRAGSTGNQSA